MLIRKLTVDDVTQQNEVSSSAFIWKVDDKNDGKTLTASLECISKRSYFGNTTLGCVGIGGVASKPEYRRAGAVRALFGKVFELAPSKGWDISILYPFSAVYYRKFGYETALTHTNAVVSFERLAGFERNTSVTVCKKEQLGRLLTLYNAVASKTNLMFERTDGTYFNLEPYHDAAYTYIWSNAAGEDRGYVSYTVDRPSSTVSVREICFFDREALAGLLGFLRCYDGNQKKLSFEKLPVSSPVFELFGEPNAFTRTLQPGGSLRVINLESVLRANVYPDTPGRFTFLCEDTLDSCNGVFTVEYGGGKCEVTRTKGTEYDFSLTAPVAARLFTGFEGLTERQLSFIADFHQKRDISDMLRAFPKREVDFWDGF